MELTENDLVKNFFSYFKSLKGELRYWRGGFYFWKGTHYRSISDDEIEIYVGKSISIFFERFKDSPIKPDIKFKFQTLMLKIKQKCHIPEEVEAETHKHLGKEYSIIALKDCLIAIKDKNGEFIYRKLRHSPDFFNLRSIPHALSDSSEAPQFQSFLKDVLPSDDDRIFIQELFGYLIYPRNSFQKAFILVGEGANGKSVLLLILRLLLGEENISSLGLDGINPSRTFPLANLVGKYANIAEDMNEIVKVAEGTFKQMVSGEVLVVERKHKDPFEWRVTTKLVFSTNTLPRFSDKSDGVYRRLIITPFQQSFLDESKQRKEFSNPTFWLSTGEFPSILRWAFDGLLRLLKNGRFTESSNAIIEKSSYRKESNPAVIFLDDHVVVSSLSELPSNDLYDSYSEWCKSNGYFPMASGTFTKEVKRRFAEAKLSPNARLIHYKRTRVWTGIKMLSDCDASKSLKVVVNSEQDEIDFG